MFTLNNLDITFEVILIKYVTVNTPVLNSVIVNCPVCGDRARYRDKIVHCVNQDEKHDIFNLMIE